MAKQVIFFKLAILILKYKREYYSKLGCFGVGIMEHKGGLAYYENLDINK